MKVRAQSCRYFIVDLIAYWYSHRLQVSKLLLPGLKDEEREKMFMKACVAENEKQMNKLKEVWVKRLCPETGREYYVCAFKTAKENGGRVQKAASQWDSPFEKLQDGVGFELSEAMFTELLLQNGVRKGKSGKRKSGSKQTQ